MASNILVKIYMRQPWHMKPSYPSQQPPSLGIKERTPGKIASQILLLAVFLSFFLWALTIIIMS